MKTPRPSRRLALAFAASSLVIGWIAAGTYWCTHQMVQSYNSVSESHQAMEKLQAIKELVQAGQSSVYNYVITEQEERLDMYRRSVIQIPKKLRELEKLLAGHPKQKSRLRQFHQLYNLHQDYLKKIVTARKESSFLSFRAASKWIAEEDDHSIRDVLNLLLEEVQHEESKELKRRAASSFAYSSQAKWALGGAAGVTFLLITAVFALLQRESGQRRAVESTNQQLETFLRSIVERIPYMVLVKEANSLRITLVNRAAMEWLGRSEEQLLGSNDYDLRPEDQAKWSMEQDQRVLTRGEIVDMEETLIREGHEERILHTQKVAIPDAQGQPAFLLTISEDITQRKREERMLQISRDTAVQSERLKSEFIRNMSHEIRTPLSIVIGMISVLRDSSLTPDQQTIAGKVETAATGLSKLTKEILDFSKIEAGTFTVEMQEMALRPMIDGILAMHQEQAKSKGISLASVIPPGIPKMLIGDPIRLRQVITELVGNAIKFTAHGEVVVRVSEAEQNDQQLWLNIKVSDTGLGIEDTIQPHVFEPFRQGDGSPTRRFGGTGLGLAISKRIVELMGGKIGFSSTPKVGSSFWCSIPFQKRRVLGPSIQLGGLPWTRARVLVIDENEVSRQRLREQLRSWALASEGVSSGETALEMLKRENLAGRSFRIVILDMHLVDMEGVAFARAVKSDPALKGTQLVVLSESPLEPSTVISLGFSAGVSKPPSPQTLLDRLAGLVDPSESSRNAA
jgi:PAS domain S-box-containing protein